MPKRYKVTGEFVNVKTMTIDGERVVGLYKNAAVPVDASQEWIDHHLSVGLIAEVPGPPDPPAPKATRAPAAPATGAPEVKAE
jgi:hypothetical protein